ncbi:20830_t:CDS:2 [Dentiscutata erythropus]|uniref:20830_t:CDS:1 n=1 Tax=Dentiscutata erythropus TaxID=1348616 RepID=A0A9N8Z9Z6_9GLOM|nr:20830_t:CDS:2 [Dentiscutata erythropus]
MPDVPGADLPLRYLLVGYTDFSTLVLGPCTKLYFSYGTAFQNVF